MSTLELHQEQHLATDRVRQHTAPHVNDRIDLLSRASVAAAIEAGPEAVQLRLAELDQEWDVDRALMVNFAVAGAVTYATGLKRLVSSPILGPYRTGFLVFLGVQMGFLLLHGTAGWCPPASVFRRLGFRTQREIESERAALLAALPTAAE